MKISKLNRPKHIAFIIDGNRRWAKKRGLSAYAGHKKGMMAVENVIDLASKYGIEYVTFYVFSTENWKRNQDEIDGIFAIIREYISTSLDSLLKNNYKIVSMGDLNAFPDDLKNKLLEVIESTKNNTGTTVNLALNYGSESEIVRAFNILAEQGKKQITLDDIKQNLYTKDLPDPDFVVRTSGEQRLSNFMLLQVAYAELYFPKVKWPAFGERHFKKALKEFSVRERRFGGNLK